ncbi:uncharacterized protein MEPE_06131 [Melanopsichium pennsylvanicum]|uniref:T6SS Phospholipase effector Tle1-like catalytic domain-containing protein n=2 Tax=Melanopsichium pennsylvanicum TaxID=63383 RepID=A0AAJ5C7Y9_9BASI|nr:conserved hypothetical protein [Melanopsichium pennsylvanicum 4]SNX87421.1 uncharacterized protein MEPE_06131 [Melanopsichium pennsylvanicum]
MIALNAATTLDSDRLPSKARLTSGYPLPPPIQTRVPRSPIRIIVLCDGTAQQRNWVKTSLPTTPFSSRFTTQTGGRGDNGDKKKNKTNKSSDMSAATAESVDFFTNVALLAKVITQSSGVASTSPPTSPRFDSNSATGDSGSTSQGASGSSMVMPQIVFYQSGLGTGTGTIQNLFDQGTGLSLGSKIEEAYSFIVDNYQPGDELFLFGFSRGAYTARCINGLINWCGILSKVEMTHFANIWAAYQRRDPDDIESEVSAAEILYRSTLRYPSAESEALATEMYLYNLSQNKSLSDDQGNELKKQRGDECKTRRKRQMVIPPQIKAIGVWDTVSALGFPGLFQNNVMINFFDFYDPGLGSNVQFAFHALSLEEDRKDFLPTMWYQPSVSQTPSANGGNGEVGTMGKHMRSKQVLKQTWFQGEHSDCGGGWQYHGLSDISLIWMISQLVDPHTLPDGSTTLRPLLNIDLGLLATILDRRREWAKQVPHRSRPTINYQHSRTVHQRQWDADTMKRVVWANMAKTGATNESIHPSVVRGGRIKPESHPAFAEMRKHAPNVLEEMWKKAQDWEATLRPTEKLLSWAKRGPYPWVPNGVDWGGLNPNVAPLLMSGGWCIPEFQVGKVKEMVINAAASEDAKTMDDVDDAEEVQHRGVSGNVAGEIDVDDQPTEGWEPPSLPNPSKISNGTAASNGTSSKSSKVDRPEPPLPFTTTTATVSPLSIPSPIVEYPIIPSKELSENPIDLQRHPHLHSLWKSVYNFASTPNELVADLINLRQVSDANFHPTLVQRWLWDLGDKIGGYDQDVKVQALTAGLSSKYSIHHRQANWPKNKLVKITRPHAEAHKIAHDYV